MATLKGIEGDIQNLLDGNVLPVESNYVHTSQGEDQYLPVVRRNVCYIVSGLVFDDAGRMLLIQEAKSSCRGQWYIPAGRVEPGENLITAVQREVKEEAGLIVTVTTLLTVKLQLTRSWDGMRREVLEESGLEIEPVSVCALEMSGIWYRLAYVARPIGGRLKTLEEADSESLQANWFTLEEITKSRLKLRTRDFFKSMYVAREYLSKPTDLRHPSYQIGIQPHKYLLLRPLIIKQHSQGAMDVLCCRNESAKLPVIQMNPRSYISLQQQIKVLFCGGQESLEMACHGLLTLEHCGVPSREHDGFCLTAVFTLPEPQGQLSPQPQEGYTWHSLTDATLQETLRHRVNTEDLLIPIIPL